MICADLVASSISSFRSCMCWLYSFKKTRRWTMCISSKCSHWMWPSNTRLLGLWTLCRTHSQLSVLGLVQTLRMYQLFGQIQLNRCPLLSTSWQKQIHFLKRVRFRTPGDTKSSNHVLLGIIIQPSGLCKTNSYSVTFQNWALYHKVTFEFLPILEYFHEFN